MGGPAVRDGDIVTELLGLVEAHCVGVDPAALARIEQQFRNEWGGQRVYIVRDPNREARQAAALQDWHNGVPISVASDAHGIDRSTLYRLINRRRQT